MSSEQDQNVLSADQLIAQATCVILIHGERKGTAWLVSKDGYLLTAGHILGTEDPPIEVVDIRFADDIPRKARKTAWKYQHEKGVDFAVLKIEKDMPPGRQPLPVSQVREPAGMFRLQGFGMTLRDRSSGIGEFVGHLDVQDSFDNRLFRLRSQELSEAGYSGAAVYSDKLEAVVAIQIEKARSTGPVARDTILAMPLYRIAQFWEELNAFFIVDEAPYPLALCEKKSKLGPLVHKMCNRHGHVNDFKEFFWLNSREYPNRPQFFIVHGEKLQGHESLIIRLAHTCIKEYIEKKYEENTATFKIIPVDWPRDGNLERRKRDLRYKLFPEWYHGEDLEEDFSAAKLSGLPFYNQYRIVIIHHHLYASAWDQQNESLIFWYLAEYWASLESDDSIPQFLVFLAVEDEERRPVGWARRIFSRRTDSRAHIRDRLEKLQKQKNNSCPCMILDELTAISIEDVEEWFREYSICFSEWERQKRIEEIFGTISDQVAKRKFAEMEKYLEEIVMECQSRRASL